jgi:DNA-binding CsgD family transcriptional regulator
LLIYQLSLAQIPYGADDLAERRRIADEGEAAWLRSGGALGDVSHRIASLPLHLIEGNWLEARELAKKGRRSPDATSQKHLISTVVLAQLARIQADTLLAWTLIRELLPGGPQSVPGTIDLAPALALVRLAASLCLDEADLPAAQAWLGTHDRWLDWSGAVLGQADGQILHARYFQTARDLARARHHATRALELACGPRQPLILLSAHRALGEIETSSGQLAEARAHLDASLELADACAAPYERALTQLAIAELDLRSGAIESAEASLNEARDTFNALGAVSALARCDTMAVRLSELRAAATKTNSADLSPRELDVLRLVATGRSNREIAEDFFLSVRTVERHITNLYAKIDAKSRAEAIAYAHAHDLI